MFGCIGPSGKLSFNCSFGKNTRVGDQHVHGINALIEVVLYCIEVAIIGIGYLRRNIAFGNTIYIFRRYVEWPDYRIQAVINSLNNLAEITLMFGSVRTCGEFAFYCRLGQNSRVYNKQTYGINTLIEIVFQLIKITIVFIGNLRRYITFGNTIYIFRRYV